jgi:hypothetical protein
VEDLSDEERYVPSLLLPANMFVDSNKYSLTEKVVQSIVEHLPRHLRAHGDSHPVCRMGTMDLQEDVHPFGTCCCPSDGNSETRKSYDEVPC